MKYVALTMSRGDAPRLKDWLQYHHCIGFNEFYILLNLVTIGLFTIVSANDLLVMYMGIEILSLSF